MKKIKSSETIFVEPFLDIDGPCPFLGCSNTFRKKRKKNAMVRNALNGFSKFSFMLTTFFDEFSFFPKKIYQLETFGIIWKQK